MDVSGSKALEETDDGSPSNFPKPLVYLPTLNLLLPFFLGLWINIKVLQPL